jgi:hypothetical protein
MIPAEQESTEAGWLLFRWKIQEQKIKKAFEIFRGQGIEPILIKGWAAAEFYPRKFERMFLDIDLCVAPEQFSKAKELAEAEEVKKLNVDLHRGLRHLDTVAWEDLSAHSRMLPLGDAQIRVLRPEDHLRILCVHWLNDGGANKERLLDIFYAVENRPHDFDWNRCLGVVSEKRRSWIVCAIGLAQRFYGLALEDTPIAAEASNIPVWILRAIEKEWKSNVRLKPLLSGLGDSKEFMRQLRKRLPPNPIQATIEMEGSFAGRRRIFYQIGTFLVRSVPFLDKLKNAFLKRGIGHKKG